MSVEESLSRLEAFPSTHWSAVALAAGGEVSQARRALGELLRRYMPAMRMFLLVEKRLDPHRANDVLQSFIAERIIEKNLLARAERSRGRFRTFLLACLSNYLAMQRRHETAGLRHPGRGKLTPLVEAGQADFARDSSDVFDVAWGREVISEALTRMRQGCEESLRPDLWQLFHARVVAPALESAAPLDYAHITARFNFATPAEATNALVTAKRMFIRMLRSVVAEYADGDEVDEELMRLKKILAGAGSAQPRHR